MPKIKLFNINFSQIILIGLVLFSLSPCTVKGALLESVSVEYSKPLNKTKSVNQVNTCVNTLNADFQISVEKQSKVSPFYFEINSGERQHQIEYFTKDYQKFSKSTSGNSPPIYILYKRLKIAIA